MHALLATGAFGLLGLFLMLLGFKLFEWITRRLDVEKQLENQNIAVGIVVAALLLGISLIVVVSMM
jgi:putative membrane protein